MFNKVNPNIKELGGTIIDLRRLVNPEDKTWSATNPSIGISDKGKIAVAIRSSNYVILPNGTYHVTVGGLIKSQVWFSEIDKDYKLTNLRKINVDTTNTKFVRGLEDPKLFWRDDSWWFTAVTLEKHETPFARMVTCKLNKKCTEIESVEKHIGFDQQRPEKNWMLPYKPNPNFDFIYGPNSVIKDNVMTTWLTDNQEISALRGNTNLLDLKDSTYLAVTHKLFQKSDMVHQANSFGMIKASLRNYIHYFTRYDEHGKIIGISKGFHFYKPGVEFAAGIIERKNDFIISFGREDVSSHLAVLNKSIVLDGLQGV
jgi:hypothetical protein